VALLGAAAYGLLAGWWTPRGPLSTVEGLVALGLGLLVGLLAGLATRSRWAALVAPVTFAGVFELVRVGASGPTVDGIDPGSLYGIIAFAVGRGTHGVLAVLPMVLGTVLGAAWARRALQVPRQHSGVLHRPLLWLRRGVVLAGALALVALAALVARPAATSPIVDANGLPVPGSVAELTRLQIGGHDLAMMIRGRDERSPVLLFLAGGPGGSELGAMRQHGKQLEDDFVVVTLEQRGTGKAYDQLDPTSTMTLDRAVADVLDVTDHLRQRFGQEKVYLAGQSWGTLLGVLAAQRRPDLYAAFIGVGQMVAPAATDRVFYDDTLTWARREGNTGLVETLTRNGAPPYRDMLDYEAALSNEQDVYPYDHAGNSEGAGQMSENIAVEEYTLLEQIHLLGAFMDVFSVLYPQIQDVDLRTQAVTLDVPVYLAQGAHEAPGRARPAEQWFDLLNAPDKELVVFDTSGHRPLWEQPARFHDLMRRVLAETAQAA
jgi:proline iminopeptidase